MPVGKPLLLPSNTIIRCRFNRMPMTNFVKNKSAIHLDATVAGPLFMLSASLIFTVNTLLIKLLDHQFTAWHIGFLRFFGGMVVLILIFGHLGQTMALIASAFAGLTVTLIRTLRKTNRSVTIYLYLCTYIF